MARWLHHGSPMHHASSTTSESLSAEVERELLERIEAGDETALERIVRSHMRLAVGVAKRYRRGGLALDDLVGEAVLGLVEAARRFDRSRDVRFATYAKWWVNGYVRRYALANRRIVAPPSTRVGRRIVGALGRTRRRLTRDLGRPPTPDELASDLGATSDEVLGVERLLGEHDMPIDGGETWFRALASDAPGPEQLVAEAEGRAIAAGVVRRALAQLSDRERTIVRLRLLRDDGASLAAVGEVLGVSRERVRQLQARAEEKLRGAIAPA